MLRTMIRLKKLRVLSFLQLRSAEIRHCPKTNGKRSVEMRKSVSRRNVSAESENPPSSTVW